jgi:hypothetical protein
MPTSEEEKATTYTEIIRADCPAELASWLVANDATESQIKTACDEYKGKGYYWPDGGPRFGEPKVVPPVQPPAPTPKPKKTEPKDNEG